MCLELDMIKYDILPAEARFQDQEVLKRIPEKNLRF